VRAALQNSGLAFPHNKRITVNLAPADLPKESGRFDLPIALGIVAAQGGLDLNRLARFEFAGELSLAGDLRPVRGALAMALALQTQGQAQGKPARALVLPAASAEEAALVAGIEIHGAKHLLDLVQALRPDDPDDPTPREPLPRALPPRIGTPPALPDMRDVKGQSGAKRALEIAAIGGHSLLMIGPPGTGKSMLAQRFAGLLPPLTAQEALESAAVLSISGGFRAEHWQQRVMRSPHHGASAVALVGGGSPPRPGEISLAHHGVLFLDEPLLMCSDFVCTVFRGCRGQESYPQDISKSPEQRVPSRIVRARLQHGGSAFTDQSGRHRVPLDGSASRRSDTTTDIVWPQRAEISAGSQ
jgi:magnesium chelatase family protein